MFGVDEEEISVPPPADSPDSDIAPRLDVLIERIERPQRRFPLERAILLSLVFHVLLLVLFIVLPSGPREIDPRKGILAALVPPDSHEIRVPVQYYEEAPGPVRPNAKKNAPLSDKTRKAGGGDRSRPKSETPFVPPSSGMEGLRPGERSREASAPAGPQRSPGRASAPAAAPAPKGEQVANGAATGLVVPRGAPGGAEKGRGDASQGTPDLTRAIREAAGNPFLGEGGAPRANPGGGFVDYGAISFDTQWYDWGDYAEEMLRRIKIHWYEQIPKLFEMGPDGELTIRFYIRADGSVEGEAIRRSSGIPPYDHAAFLGIADSNPFRPLPKDLHEDREGVTITFKYLHYREEQLRPRDHVDKP